MFGEQEIVIGGGDDTFTVNVQLVLCPQPSLAMQVTSVVPTGNVLPLDGLQLMNGGGVQPPKAEAE